MNLSRAASRNTLAVGVSLPVAAVFALLLLDSGFGALSFIAFACAGLGIITSAISLSHRLVIAAIVVAAFGLTAAVEQHFVYRELTGDFYLGGEGLLLDLFLVAFGLVFGLGAAAFVIRFERRPVSQP